MIEIKANFYYKLMKQYHAIIYWNCSQGLS